MMETVSFQPESLLSSDISVPAYVERLRKSQYESVIVDSHDITVDSGAEGLVTLNPNSIRRVNVDPRNDNSQCIKQSIKSSICEHDGTIYHSTCIPEPIITSSVADNVEEKRNNVDEKDDYDDPFRHFKQPYDKNGRPYDKPIPDEFLPPLIPSKPWYEEEGLDGNKLEEMKKQLNLSTDIKVENLKEINAKAGEIPEEWVYLSQSIIKYIIKSYASFSGGNWKDYANLPDGFKIVFNRLFVVVNDREPPTSS